MFVHFTHTGFTSQKNDRSSIFKIFAVNQELMGLLATLLIGLKTELGENTEEFIAK